MRRAHRTRLGGALVLFVALLSPGRAGAQSAPPQESTVPALIDNLLLLSLSDQISGGSFRVHNSTPISDDTRFSTLKLPWETELDVGSRHGTLHLEAAAAALTADDHLGLDTPSGFATVSIDWLSLGAFGSAGWSYPLAERWTLRPSAGLSLGYTENDARYNEAGRIELAPLIEGTLANWDAWSASTIGSLSVLHARPIGHLDLDVEGRFSLSRTKVFDSSSEVQEGTDTSRLLALRADLEGPTAFSLSGTEVRWATFAGAARFLDAEDVLEFDELYELGAGLVLPRLGRIPPLELGLAWITGPDLSGWSIGLAPAR